ncbi:MAG: hypothetical protein JMN27_13790 [gamma proteobacterium endosymbiont of Lamellibrachia anaximandri]|nr:hypothetical protein [gamma proteobacterium endosymbiont of Lamellibrachia anaximandri]MBL3534886.1 hypothetical protein [gamma proteobacterium endosymbiont of Lamellibrachia anaximandri]
MFLFTFLKKHPTACRKLSGILTPILLVACGGAEQTADPVVVDHPVAYVQRPVTGIEQEDMRRLITFNPGADLYLRERASPSADEHNLTRQLTGGGGDVRDLQVSYDGERLLFSLRLPLIEGLDEADQPSWNIWEYNHVDNSLRRVITSDTHAEAGHDIAPHYLPDGRILFSSSRQKSAKALLLDEGKPQYAAINESGQEPIFVPHVMQADGSDIQQISFNQSHDLDPTVLSDGRVVFSRWERSGDEAIDLYQMNPDGTNLQLLYGADSHATGTDGATVQFLRPRELPDGGLLTLLRPFNNLDGGDLVRIDIDNFVDHNRPLSGDETLPGTAQPPATINLVRTDSAPSTGGRYRDAFPLRDGTDRLLLSWSQCRLRIENRTLPCTEENLADPRAEEAPPLYGIYVYDPDETTQMPVLTPTDGVVYEEVVALQARKAPAIIFDNIPDFLMAEEGVGLLQIRSVYDLDGQDTAVPDLASLSDPALTTADQRPLRFLRLFKPVALPPDDLLDIPGSAFGRNRSLGMREILGYAPIEPDGSVNIKVPADTPFSFSLLDRNGRRVGDRHDHWLHLRPGETLTCHGCHDPADTVPHGRKDALPVAVNVGALGDGLPFPNSDPAIWANQGETMAQARGRISCQSNCAALSPNVDLLFEDHWTDPAVRAKDPAFSYLYADVDAPAPTTESCQQNWSRLCRTVIHYEQHIHPLWNVPRPLLDANGQLIEDRRCNLCHGTIDENGALQVSAGQLDLSDGPADAQSDHFKAYRELLYSDNVQEIINGLLLDQLVQDTDGEGNLLFETDAHGNLILDADGLPIPIMVTVRAPGPSMRAGSSQTSYFFDRFMVGGSHEGYLSPAELRLLSEWLDIGAQYWNNPFDIPVED